MEVKILEKKDTTLKLEFKGEGHSLGNMLREELFNNKKIVIAGYRKEHPLIDKSVFIVRTKGEKASDALKKAIKSLESKFKKLKTLS